MNEGADSTVGRQFDPEADVLSVFDELTNLNEHPKLKGSVFPGPPSLEACLRRVLRPYDEAGFRSPDDGWMIALRARLNVALNSLTQKEIQCELEIIGRADVAAIV